MKESVFFKRLNNHSEGISEECKERLKKFRAFLDTLTPSQKSHYHQLEESYHTPVYDFLSKALDDFGFENAKKEVNSKKPDVMIFWEIYGMIPYFESSPFFAEIEGGNRTGHNASAHVRCETLKADIDFFIQRNNW